MTEIDRPVKKSGLLVPIVVIVCIGIAVGFVGYYLATNAERSVHGQVFITPSPAATNVSSPGVIGSGVSQEPNGVNNWP